MAGSSLLATDGVNEVKESELTDVGFKVKLAPWGWVVVLSNQDKNESFLNNFCTIDSLPLAALRERFAHAEQERGQSCSSSHPALRTPPGLSSEKHTR